MARCTAKTKAGAPCRKTALKGAKLCAVHDEAGNRTGGMKPTKLEQRTIDAARRGFLVSGTHHGAARAAGVNRGTLSRWLQTARQDRAEQRETDCTRMLDALEDAKDELIAELGAQVQANAVATGDTRTMLRLLAVLDPDTWAQRSEIRHGGAEGAPPISISGPPATQVVHVAFDSGMAADAAAIAAGED